MVSRSRHRCHRRGGRAASPPADAAARRERRASSRGARCGVAKPPPLPSPRRPSSKPAGRRCRQARTPSVIGERAARRGEAATIAAASTQLSSKHAGCRCRQARGRASSESARCGVAKPPLVPSPKQPSSKHAGRQARDRPPPAARGMARPRRHRCHRRGGRVASRRAGRCCRQARGRASSTARGVAYQSRYRRRHRGY